MILIPKVLKAIINLKNNDDWKIILEWLETERIKALEDSSMQVQEVLSRWAQGQAWVLKVILNTIKDAENIKKTNKAMKDIEDKGFVS